MASATPPQPEPLPFTAQAPLQNGMKAGALFAGAGTFVSAIQNAIGEHKAGAMGVFTRTGSTIAFFAAMGGSYSYVSSAAANFREKNDAFNAAAGGCASGMVYGASARSIPAMAGACLGMATLMGTFRAAGASLRGSYAISTPSSAGADLGVRPTQVHEGELGWREQRDERRKRFFKQPKETESD